MYRIIRFIIDLLYEHFAKYTNNDLYAVYLKLICDVNYAQ